MRSEIPETFGTSLIDLLVGALTIVALLWVLALPNSGYTGSGEEERSSGMVAVEQFGIPHIASVRVVQPGRVDTRFEVKFNDATIGVPYFKQSAFTANAAIVEETLTSALSQRPDLVKTAVYEILPTGLDEPITVTLRLVAPTGGFYKGIHVMVEKLDSLPITVEIGIEVCCSPTQPHYLRTLSMSGNGEREALSFWHDSVYLESVLDTGHSTSSTASNDWIRHFAQRVKDGDSVSLRSFSRANPISCSNSPSRTLTIKFEPDGDISVRPGESNETPGSSAQNDTVYVGFANRFDELLIKFPRP